MSTRKSASASARSGGIPKLAWWNVGMWCIVPCRPFRCRADSVPVEGRSDGRAGGLHEGGGGWLLVGGRHSRGGDARRVPRCRQSGGLPESARAQVETIEQI